MNKDKNKPDEYGVDEYGVDEYDVKIDAWDIYQKMYKNNLHFKVSSVIRDSGRPYIECQFEHNGKSTSKMKFSGETDFNFSNEHKRELHRSRYENYKKILERDLACEPTLETYLKLLDECMEMHHSQENVSIMLQTGNIQGSKGSIGLDRLDVWLLILLMRYKYNVNLLQNHCTMENCSAIEDFLDLFDNVYDYANTIYHIDRKLVNDLIDSGKRALDSAYNLINYMLLAKRFWKQKRRYLENHK